MNVFDRLNAKLEECYRLEEQLAEVRLDLARIQQEPEYQHEIARQNAQQVGIMNRRIAKGFGTPFARDRAEAAVVGEGAKS